jgi:hypothetical protein
VRQSILQTARLMRLQSGFALNGAFLRFVCRVSFALFATFALLFSYFCIFRCFAAGPNS